MKIAICGNVQIGMQLKEGLRDSGIEISHFIDEGRQGGVLSYQ